MQHVPNIGPITFTLAEDMPNTSDQVAAVVLSLAQAQSLPLDLCAQIVGRTPENAVRLLALFAEGIQGTLRALGRPATVAEAFAVVPPITPPKGHDHDHAAG